MKTTIRNLGVTAVITMVSFGGSAEIISKKVKYPKKGEMSTYTIFCPKGKKMMSGGYVISRGMVPIASFPLETSEGSGWQVNVEVVNPHPGQDIDFTIMGDCR